MQQYSCKRHSSPSWPALIPATIEQTAGRIFESFSDRLKAMLNGRQERALKLALGGNVTHKAARVYSVRSENQQHAYLVDLEQGTCTCPDCQKAMSVASFGLLIRQAEMAVGIGKRTSVH
jgi:hypothetical protein